MKKIIVKFVVVYFCALYVVQAYYPTDLSWVSARDDLPESLCPIHQAADVILWANSGEAFYTGGKQYHIVFEKDNRKLFDDIVGALNVLDPSSVCEYLRKSVISLSRVKDYYTLCYKGISAQFRVCADNLFYAEKLLNTLFDSVYESEKCKDFCEYFSHSQNIDPSIACAIMIVVKGFFSTDRKLQVYKAYLEAVRIDSPGLAEVVACVQSSGCAYFMAQFYCMYSESVGIDSDLIEGVFKAVEVMDIEAYKADIYAAYARFIDPDLSRLLDILEKTKNFQSQTHKAKVFAACIGCGKMPAGKVSELFKLGKQFSYQSDAVKIYAAYIQSESIYRRQAEDALNEAKNQFPKGVWAQIYAAYISRIDADFKLIELIFTEAQKFNQYGQKRMYIAYLCRPSIIPKLAEYFIKELENLEGGAEALAALEASHAKKHSKSARK